MSIANSTFGASIGSFLTQVPANGLNGSSLTQNRFTVAGDTFAFGLSNYVYARDGSGNLYYVRPGGTLTKMDSSVESIAVGGDVTLYDLERGGVLQTSRLAALFFFPPFGFA